MHHLSKYSVTLVTVFIAALAGCGGTTSNRLRDTATGENSIKAAIESDSSGSTILYASGPTATSKMTFCIVDSKSVCIKKEMELKLTRSVGDRKIFRLSEPVSINSNDIWLFVAEKSDGTKLEQKVKISAKGDSSDGGSLPSSRLNWKVLLMASDQGNSGAWIDVFDNARKKLKQIFTDRGVGVDSFRELSLHPDEQTEKVKPTSVLNFSESLKSFGSPGPNDACLVHMTSHGSRDGFNIGSQRLRPTDLNQALEAGCGSRPTVVLISACFSGLYVLDSSNLKKPNRIILTAARNDVTSFGCSPEFEYTYWDSCLISSMPKAKKWKELASEVVSCIVEKEGGQTASFPQTFIGTDVTDLDLPAK